MVSIHPVYSLQIPIEIRIISYKRPPLAQNYNLNFEKEKFRRKDRHLTQMVDAHFRPDHFKWVIIKNRHYNVLRDTPGYHGFQDIDQVE